MRLEDVKPGDVLTYWFDTGAMGATICYARVVSVGAKMIVVEGANGGRARKYPWFFHDKLSPTSWSPWNKEGN
jgi:hypothetical protein